MKDEKIGVLVTNIGTPNSPTREDVKLYLNEFLMDPQVIRLPWVFRALLVQGVIVPIRAGRSARLYQKIWRVEGSPLLVESLSFKTQLQQALGDKWVVALGMRYGQPSIQQALETMLAAGIQRLVVFPLFPQYALSSTQSSIDAALVQLTKLRPKMQPTMIEEFHLNPGFIEAWCEQFHAKALRPYDHVVFSFHGLPKAHLTILSQACAGCPKTAPCPPVVDADASQTKCYRRQSFRTAAAIADKLGLKSGDYSVGFQSRLGPNEWILPNTVDVLNQLVESGKKRVVVLCPSFVTDCLETLEEVQMGLCEQFLDAGGQEFTAIDCLNSHPAWVSAAKEIVCQSLSSN